MKRHELGLRQVDVAKAANVSVNTIISLEMGKASGIRLDKLMSVLDAIGLELHITGFDEGDGALRLSPVIDLGQS